MAKRNNQVDQIEGAVPDYNLNEVDAWDGETHSVDEGDYLWQVEDGRWRTSSGGHPEFLAICSVISDADGGDTDMAGRRVYQRYYASPKARKRLKAFVLATGVEIDSAGRFDPDSVIGCSFLARAVKESWMSVDPAEPDKDIERVSTKLQGERSVPAEAEEAASPAETALPPPARAAASAPPSAPALAKAPAKATPVAATSSPAAAGAKRAAPRLFSQQ